MHQHFFIFAVVLLNLCNNSLISNRILLMINIHKVTQEVLKSLGLTLPFQHFPLDRSNVDERKIIFDPSIQYL